MDRQQKPLNDKEIRPDGDSIEISTQSPVLRWLDNFWYHYKWHTIIAAFFVVVLLFCVFQQVNDTKEDVVVVYAGNDYILSAELPAVQDAIAQVLYEDVNLDGVRLAEIVQYMIFSDEEIQQSIEQKDDGNYEEDLAINVANNANQIKQFNQMTSTGECSLYLCSPYVYDMLLERNVLQALKDICNTIPDSAYDAYCVRLVDTAWYHANAETLKVLPDDTLICLFKPFVWGSSADDAVYQNALRTFLNMIQLK